VISGNSRISFDYRAPPMTDVAHLAGTKIMEIREILEIAE
jgi:hypothetical protein